MDTIINIVICRDIAGQMHADGLDPLRLTCRTTHTVVRNILCPAKGLHMGIIDDTACYTLCLQINLDRFETFTLSSSTRDCSTWHCIHPAIRLCMYLIIYCGSRRYRWFLDQLDFDCFKTFSLSNCASCIAAFCP